MRAFVGIDFNSDVKAAISEMQTKLKGSASKGRWKYHDNFHLTLKFFENLSDSKKCEINCAASAVCKNFHAFKLGMGDLGIFNGRDSIRVLWMGLLGDTSKLLSLFEELDNSFQGCGFEKEKRSFKPHVTIAQDLIFNTSFENLKNVRKQISFPDIVVDRLHLFKSEQIGSKRVYTKIEEYMLM